MRMQCAECPFIDSPTCFRRMALNIYPCPDDQLCGTMQNMINKLLTDDTYALFMSGLYKERRRKSMDTSNLTHPVSSALLECETCGNKERVWLNRCARCKDPTSNWYEQRIAFLEKDNERWIKERVDLGIKYDLLQAEYKKTKGE